MGSGTRLPWEEAAELAKRVVAALEDVTARMKVVGSLRRRRPHVSDIEIVVEPYQVAVDLFDRREPDVEAIQATLEELGERVKGGDKYVQVANLLGEQDVKLDVFIVTPPAQWGSIVAIRTGPAALGRHCVTAMRDRGYRHTHGHVVRRKDGEVQDTPSEREFFELAGVPFVEPQERDALLARL